MTNRKRLGAIATILTTTLALAAGTASAQPRPYERDHATVERVAKIQAHVRHMPTRHLFAARPYGRG